MNFNINSSKLSRNLYTYISCTAYVVKSPYFSDLFLLVSCISQYLLSMCWEFSPSFVVYYFGCGVEPCWTWRIIFLTNVFHRIKNLWGKLEFGYVESVFPVYFYNKDILLHTIYTGKFLTVKGQYYPYLRTS